MILGFQGRKRFVLFLSCQARSKIPSSRAPNDPTAPIPKTWRLKAAGILRAGKPGTVLLRQRARRDGASLTSCPFEFQLRKRVLAFMQLVFAGLQLAADFDRFLLLGPGDCPHRPAHVARMSVLERDDRGVGSALKAPRSVGLPLHLLTRQRHRDRELGTDSLRQKEVDLDMTGNGLDFARFRVAPDRMRSVVTDTEAALGLQMPEQLAPFHPTRTVVFSAPGAVRASA